MIVSNCDPTRLTSALAECSGSALYETLSGTRTHVICSVASKVIHIGATFGFWIDQIWMFCDDSERTQLGPFGDGRGGAAYSVDCPSGYSGPIDGGAKLLLDNTAGLLSRAGLMACLALPIPHATLV